METDPEASDAVSGTETRTLGFPPSGDTTISEAGQPENAGRVVSMYTMKVGHAAVDVLEVAGSCVRQETGLTVLVVGRLVSETLHHCTAAPHVAVPLGPVTGTETLVRPKPLT